MIGPGVPRKLAFAQRVGVLPADHAGAPRSPTGLHRHPRFAKYTCVYDVQLLAIWRIPLLAVVSATQSSPTRRPNAETPSQLLSLPVSEKTTDAVLYHLHIIPVVDLPPSLHMHESSFMCSGLTTFEMPAPPLYIVTQILSHTAASLYVSSMEVAH